MLADDDNILPNCLREKLIYKLGLSLKCRILSNRKRATKKTGSCLFTLAANIYTFLVVLLDEYYTCLIFGDTHQIIADILSRSLLFK